MSIPAPSRPLLCITGKKSKANANLLSFESEYIRFLDYQPQSNFDSILAHSTLLIDLTTREDCLVCGGYEALALGVPILLSDTEVARQTFGAGAIYAKNDSSSLRDAILDFLHETGRENGAWSESSFDKLRKEFLISWSLFCQRAFESIFDGRSSV